MSKRFHVDTSQEYKFCKGKVAKLLHKASAKGDIPFKRAMKQSRKFINRMKEIERYHSNMNWPHPEAEFKMAENLKRELEMSRQMPGKQPLANPDGSLFQKSGSLIESGAGYSITGKSIQNPDGSLFETPVMPGSVLTGDGPGSPHSQEKVQKFLSKDDDSFLRTED